MSQKILCLSPHADDVELAMGGYIARLVDQGDQVTIALLSASDYKRPDGTWVEGHTRIQEQKMSVKTLGCGWWKCILFEENEALAAPRGDVVSKLQTLIGEQAPDGLFVPLPWFNQDHTVVWEAVQAALRPRPGFEHPKGVYAYEMPGQEFGPPSPLGCGGYAYVDLAGEHIDRKKAALGCHKSQAMLALGSRKLIGHAGVEAIAKLRGLEAGVPFAERFQLVRMVNYL